MKTFKAELIEKYEIWQNCIKNFDHTSNNILQEDLKLGNSWLDYWYISEQMPMYSRKIIEEYEYEKTYTTK